MPHRAALGDLGPEGPDRVALYRCGVALVDLGQRIRGLTGPGASAAQIARAEELKRRAAALCWREPDQGD